MEKKIIIFVILFVMILISPLIIYLIYNTSIPWCPINIKARYKWSDYNKNLKIKTDHAYGTIPIDKEVCYENLSLFHEVMKDIGIDFWLSDGTALGFKRENDIIDYDDDIDVGFFYKDSHIFWKNIEKFKEKGFVLAEARQLNTFVVFIRKNEKVDIDMVGEGLYCDQGIKNYRRCKHILPYLKDFDKINIKNKEYLVPKDNYLEYKYGIDWKIPKKTKKLIFNS